MADDPQRSHEEAFVFYCEQRHAEYTKRFGTEEPEGQILLPSAELQMFGWPGGGVYKYPPQGTLDHWHYVTEALSQPRDPVRAIEEGHSEYAFELVMSTRDECNWAPNVLMNLARYYLGENGRPFYPFQAIPCGGPLVVGTDTKLNFLISVEARDYEPVLELPGGKAYLVHMIGIAEDELKPCFDLDDPTLGVRALYRLLWKHGIGSCSIPERDSLAESVTFLDEWQTELDFVRMEMADRE